MVRRNVSGLSWMILGLVVGFIIIKVVYLSPEVPAEEDELEDPEPDDFLASSQRQLAICNPRQVG